MEFDSRIAIVTIDVNLALARPRGIVSSSPGIVVDQWYNNTGVSSLVDDILHVVPIGESSITTRPAVLILRLIKNDGAPVCDLAFGNSSSNMGNVADSELAASRLQTIVRDILISSLQVRGIGCPQGSVHSLQPSRETTARSLSIDIRSRTSEEIDSCLLSHVKERLEGKVAFSPVLARFSFEEGPVDVE